MMGLLDEFLGQGWQDPKSNAVMQLAGGLLQGNFGAGAKDYGNVMAGAQDVFMKRKMMQIQFEQATRKNQLINDAIAGNMGVEQPVGMSGGAGTPQASAHGGSFTGGNGSGMGGVPRSAIVSDLAFNDGKNLGEWAFKRGSPNWTNVNGNMVDTNAPGFRGGLQGGLQTSASGQTSLTTIGPDGQPIISAPQGALKTFGDYQEASKAADAKYSFTDVPDGNGGTVKMPTSKALQMLGGGTQEAIPSLGNAQPTPAQMAIIRADIAKTGNPNPTLNFNTEGIQPASAYRPTSTSTSSFGETPSQAQLEADKAKLLEPLQANAAFTKGRADKMVAYEDGLNGRVQQGSDLNMRLQESLKAMDDFRNGGGQETRAYLAQKAQAIGLPDSVVKGIAGGDLASMQEFNKLAVQQAMEQLKQSMGGAGRIAQAEFKVFQANNPNLDTDANAVRKIYDFNTRVYQRDIGEQKAFNEHVDSGKNPASFPMLWTSKQAQQGYTNPQLSAAKNPVQSTAQKFGMLPNAKDYAGKRMKSDSGAIYKSNGTSWEKE